MSRKQYIKDTWLGLLVIVSTVLLIAALYFIGSNKSMFSKTISISTSFRNINGLQAGNNVRYSGINIGTVDKITIENDTTIKVMMIIDADMEKVIRENYIASIGTDGLMGNKLVNIDPTEEKGEYVHDGSVINSIRSVNTEEMLRTLEYTNLNVATISANLKTITENINKSRGTLYTLLNDSALARNLSAAILNAEHASNELNDITGSISSLISDVQSGKGMLGKILSDSGAATDLENTAINIRKATESMNNSAASLQQITSRINEGEGSIGMLLNDSLAASQLKNGIIRFNDAGKKLNEDLEGLKHSFLLKRYFRKLGKKNAAGGN